MTCRTHFFRTIRDQHTFFRAQDRDGLGPDLYEALHLLPFDGAQIRAYLERKQGAAGVDKAIDLIRSVHDLEGLAARPFNLRLISEQLERLERRVAEGRSIDAAALYDELAQSWLERDMGKHQLERVHKMRLMEDLAALLWSREARRIDVAELEAWLRRRLLGDDDLHAWVQLVHPDPAVLAEDLRTATFIVRPGANEFEFAHTSLLKYFLARYLHRTMRVGDVDAWAGSPGERRDPRLPCRDRGRPGRRRVPAAPPRVRRGVPTEDQRARGAIRLALGGTGWPARVAAGLPAGNGRPAWDPGRAPAGAEVDMAGCVLEGADLRDARLRRVRLDGADLHDARLTRAELHHCSFRAADLSGASLQGAIVRATNVDGAGSSARPATTASGCGTTASRQEVRPRGASWPSSATSATSLGPPARLEVLAGASGTVTSLAWAPDGTRLAAGHADRRRRVEPGERSPSAPRSRTATCWRWRGRPTAGAWPALATTRACGCGTRPGPTLPPGPGEPHRLGAGAGVVARRRVPGRRRRRRGGAAVGPGRARPPPGPLRATAAGCRRWRGRPTAGAWPAPAATGRCGCGTRPGPTPPPGPWRPNRRGAGAGVVARRQVPGQRRRRRDGAAVGPGRPGAAPRAWTATAAGCGRWRGRPTARAWPAPATTGRCGCGTRPGPAPPAGPWTATAAGCRRWRGRPTAGASPAPATTGRCGCGTRPARRRPAWP